MMIEIKWTKTAIESYTDVLLYLQNNWSKKEVEKFIKSVEAIENLILAHPKSGYSFISCYRKINIDDINSMIYEIEDNTIFVVLIWDGRQNPLTIDEILSH